MFLASFLDQFWLDLKFGSLWNDLGSVFVGMLLVSFLDQVWFGLELGSLWNDLGSVLGCVGFCFGITFGSSFWYLDLFGLI